MTETNTTTTNNTNNTNGTVHLTTSTAPVELTFGLGGPADAEALSDVGARAFPHGHPVDPADIAAYVGKYFTPEAFKADMASPERTFFVARAPSPSPSPSPSGQLSGKPVAFAVLLEGEADGYLAHLPPAEVVEVQRIYADPEYHGSGAAGRLMEYTLDQARARGFKHVWLGAWERNVRAQGFYAKFGFKSVGTRQIWVGEDLHTDLILLREL